MPLWSMYLVASVLQVVQPWSAVTVDQLRMLGIRNVGEIGMVERTFGFTPKSLEGNIDFMRSVTTTDGLKIAMGFRPSRIRDH